MISLNAAVLTEVNKPLEIKTLSSRKLKRGQVLVKILFSGICRSQLMEAKGLRGEDPWVPHLLGHEASGVVMDIGPGVNKVKLNDEVILTWIKGEGIEGSGAKYDHNGEVVNSGKVTTFSNYSVVSENRVVKKPNNLPFDTAVLFGCALPTGVGMVLNELDINKKSTVCVLGLGGIGLASVMALLALGVKKIVACDIAKEKLSYVKGLGVSVALNSSNEDIKTEIFKLFPNGLDFCFESAGKISTIEFGYSLIKKNGGKLIFASHPPEGEKISLNPHDLISGKSISATWGGSIKPDEDIPKIFRILNSKKINLESLLTKRYSLNQINDALSDLEQGKVFRPLIEMNHND